jgi:hypothetical protein
MCNPYVKVLYIYQLDDVYLPVEENSGKQSIYSYYETLTKNVPNKEKRELVRKENRRSTVFLANETELFQC